MDKVFFFLWVGIVNFLFFIYSFKYSIIVFIVLNIVELYERVIEIFLIVIYIYLYLYISR